MQIIQHFLSMSVDIDLTLTTPANAAGPVTCCNVLGRWWRWLWPPRAAPAPGAAPTPAVAAARPAGPPRPPGLKEQLIQKGWGYASLGTSSIQLIMGAGLTKALSGLTNKGKYRKPDDWGGFTCLGMGCKPRNGLF